MNKPKQNGRWGVVGTWLTPKGELGGIMPVYLSNSQKDALYSVGDMDRHNDFPNAHFWLCEVKLRPIKKVILSVKQLKEKKTIWVKKKEFVVLKRIKK